MPVHGRSQCGGHPGLQPSAGLGVLGGVHASLTVQPGHQIAAGVGNGHIDGDLAGFDQFAESAAQPVQTVSGAGGDEHRPRQGAAQLGQG